MQVFLNLGQNALQAMPDGGTLEILTTRRRRSRLGYGQFAEVRFRDTGIGIPRDRLKKLFIPFYTTKQKGTGLGLAIRQRIINQHGGTIEVRSTIGQGSTFSVFLPAAEPVPESKVEDITETGRLDALGTHGSPRGDATPIPSKSEPAAISTSGGRIESISPHDSMPEIAATALAPEATAANDPGTATPTPTPTADADADADGRRCRLIRMQPAKILVADDEQNLRRVLVALLRRDGYEVVQAASGLEAIERLADVDVVITDLRMPGADGMEVLRTASKNHPHVPVIMITAYGSVGQAVEAIKAGAFDYIEKPFEQDSIRSIVAKAIGQAAANRTAPRSTLYPPTELEARGKYGLVGTSARDAVDLRRDRARSPTRRRRC